MPGRDPITQVGDLAAIQKNVDSMIEMVEKFSATIKSVPDISMAYKNAGGGAELKKTTDDLTEANKALLAAQKQLDAERAKSLTMEGEIAKQIAIQRELNKQKATDMRAEARDVAGLNDAYKKLELQSRAAQREAKNLASTPGTPQATIDAANAKAKGFSDQLKTIDAAVGQHFRNVGNYSEALKTLEHGLGDAKSRLDQLTQSGEQNSEEGQKLSSEINLLGQLVSQQAKGFTSLSREILATGKALETMAAQGLSSTEYFKELSAQYAESRRELKDFREDQALLANDAPKLAALTLVAKGLAGAYAIGVGAIGLFSDGNEKLEKELNKMVAVMTVLQGLHELHEFMERKGAIATIASGVAQGFKNFVMTGSIKPMQANTEATAENTVVQEGNTLATGENVVATEADIVAKEAQAVATEEVVVATEEASSAMIGFRIALLAIGIGALLILLPAIANAMDLFKKSTKEAAKEEEEIAELTQKMNDILMEQIKLLDEDAVHMKKNLENALSLMQKNNQNYYDQFAIKKQIADLDAKTAENDLKHAAHTDDLGKAYRAIKGEADKLTASLDPMLAKQEQLIEVAKIWKRVQADPNYNSSQAYYDLWYKYHLNMTEQEAKEEMDANDKKLASTKKLIEDKRKLTDNYDKATLDQTGQEVERARFSADEQRELTKAMTTTRAQAIIDSNALILSNEKSTEEQKVAAEASSLGQRLIMIEAERKAKLEAPGVTKVQGDIINIEAEAARTKVINDSLENRRLLRKSYADRRLAAEYEIYKASMQAQLKADEEASNNLKLSLQNRLQGFEDYQERQRQLINSEASFQKQKAGLQAKELNAIEADRQAKLLELFNVGQVKQSQILLSSLEQQEKALDSSAKLDGIRSEVKALDELNNAYKAGGLSAAAFAKQKELISNKVTQEALDMQLATLKYIRGEYAKNGQDTIAIDLQIAALDKQNADNKLKRDDEDAKHRQELKQKEHELAVQVEQSMVAFVNARYERELNAIQKQIDQNNKLKEAETTRISSSTLSEQQKAAALIELNAKNQAQNEELARQQRDIKVREAKFAKAASIAETIQQGTIAATAALKIPVYGEAEAIVIAAITAARVAQIVATPIPTYFTGTASSKAGWALTDELGPELYKTPKGETFLGNDKPTLRYLQAGTEIIPHDKVKQYRTMQAVGSQDSSRDLEKKIDRLNDTIIQTSQAQVNAVRKQKVPIINIYNDAAFQAYAKTSAQ